MKRSRHSPSGQGFITIGTNRVGVLSQTSYCPVPRQRQLDSILRKRNLTHLEFRGCNLGEDGLETLLSGLPNHSLLHTLVLDNCQLKAKDFETLARHLPKLRRLEYLALPSNRMTARDLETLLPALSRLSLQEIDLGTNAIRGTNGIKALGRLLEQNKELTCLNIAYNPWLPENYAGLCKVLGEAHQLEELRTHMPVTPEAYAALVRMVNTHPGLQLFEAEEHPQQTSQAAHITDLELDGANKNLRVFLPQTPYSKALCEGNRTKAVQVGSLLAQEPESLSYAQHAVLQECFGLISRCTPSNMTRPRNQKDVKRYHAFMNAMPRLPAQGGADALFLPDEKGYAPLDNPAIWRSADKLFALLEAAGQPLDEAFLERRTPRGVSFLESAAGGAKLSPLLEQLHSRGIRLCGSRLMDENGQPTRLFSTVMERGNGAALFRHANWKGESRFAVMRAYRALPEAQQREVAIRTLCAELDAESSRGMGR